MTYLEFIEQKKHSIGNSGFEPKFIPDMAFDFQRAIIEKAVRKGRTAIFADTGLGKTLIQLSIAQNIVKHTNKKVLILTPLAVAFQFIKEAEKLGIDDIEYSKQGKHTKKIVVCNYERLHYFNSEDFVCVILDECFAPDTKIRVNRNNSWIEVDIKECLIGDKVLNCTGLDTIKAIKKKKIDYAIRIKFNGQWITSSPKHPYFTQRGWVAAKELQPNDFICSTDKAMRILQGGILHEVEGRYKEEVLHNVLLSEMANETTRIFSESSQPRSSGKEREIKSGMAKNIGGANPSRNDKEFEANVKSGNKGESVSHFESDETQTFSAWGKWNGDDIASAINEGCIVSEMGFGLSYITGQASTGLSNKLQSRFGKLREKNCNRTGWELSLQPKESGLKKRLETDFFRMEGFEVLEQGCTELDKHRDETGTLYFYDLEIERHPSFTINSGLVHNSSILKNFEGAIKSHVTAFVRKIPFRFLSTATPAPNDYIEFGTSSECLGYLPYMDMLQKFFANNENNIRPQDIGSKWYLKPHAKDSFFNWLNQWSISIKKPSDLGFSDERYKLPNLIENKVFVKNEKNWVIDGQIMMFNGIAATMSEVREEQKGTIKERCEKAVDISSNYDTSVYWCNFNDEGDLLDELDRDAVQLKGGMSLEKKEEILLDFANGDIKKLITKPKITSFGLNWQHCNHTIYFPTWSYEQYYQSIRRFWRFGQTKDVTVDLLLSDGQKRVIDTLLYKTQKAKEFNDSIQKTLNGLVDLSKKEFTKEIIKPSFI